MRIGVPKEIKNREHRVSLTPDGVRQLVAHGHQVLVQSQAGADVGFSDADYAAAGATIVATAREAWQAELIVKVKEPLPEEYRYLRPEMLLFTYLHLAASPRLAHELLRQGVCAIGYETVQQDDGSLPLLAPMSRIAGRVAMQLGAHFLLKENGCPWPGMGRLLGRVDNTAAPGTVLILGGGNVGRSAAAVARGLGADVIILEASEQRRAELAQAFPELAIQPYSQEHLHALLPECEIVIGAALLPGGRTPLLLRRDDIARMRERAVLVDVAIDQGGVSETSRPTTYAEPVYLEEGVLHCCLPNLPAAAPVTSTQALTAATLPYVLRLADQGLDEALRACPPIARGVNIRSGRIVHPGVAEALRSAELATEKGEA